MRRTGVAAVAVLAVLAAAGCSSQVRGKQHAAGPVAPSSLPSSQSSSDAPSTSSPPSSDAPPSKTPTVPLQGAIIESHRLGVAMVSPDQIFHAKQPSTCGIPKGPFPSVTQATSLVFGGSDQLLKIGGYVTGWFDCFDVKGSANSLGGVVGLMEAYDEPHAKSLAQVIALSASGGAHSKSMTLPGLPDAYVGVYPTEDGNSAVNGLLVQGRMVMYVNLDTGDASTGGAGRLKTVRGMAAALIRAERAKLTSFSPTPVSKLGKLSDDPEQLDAKTAQPAGNPGWYDGGYTLQNYAEIQSDSSELPVLRKNGMSEVYLRSGFPSGESHAPTGYVSLYKLSNAKAAKNVWNMELSVAKHDSSKPDGLPLPKGKQRKGAPPVPKNIQCLLSYDSSDHNAFKHDCWVLAGRYVAQVDLVWSADDSKAAHVRSKDSSRVLLLVDKQLQLTPQ